MRQQTNPVVEKGRWVYLAAIGSVAVFVSMGALFFRSIPRVSLARNHLKLHLTDKQAAALLAEREEAADARKKAARYTLAATNFSPWL